MTTAHDNHPAVVARNQLLTIADAWPAIEARLRPGSSADRSGVRIAPGSRVPIDVQVSDVIAEIVQTAHFYARTLLEETDWRPPETWTTPNLLRELAAHVGHWTEHDDDELRRAFVSDCEGMAKKARQAAWPSGRRMMRTGVRCEQHDTSDLGERIPCKGEYRVLMDPERPGVIPDMVCNVDRDHRITPEEWQRAMRKKALDPQAAARLVARIREDQGGSAA